MAKYMVTGWCSKRSNWNEDYVVAKNKQVAVELFKFLNPTLRRVKAHRLQNDNPYIYNPKNTMCAFVSPRSLEIASNIVRTRRDEWIEWAMNKGIEPDVVKLLRKQCNER